MPTFGLPRYLSDLDAYIEQVNQSDHDSSDIEQEDRVALIYLFDIRIKINSWVVNSQRIGAIKLIAEDASFNASVEEL